MNFRSSGIVQWSQSAFERADVKMRAKVHVFGAAATPGMKESQTFCSVLTGYSVSIDWDMMKMDPGAWLFFALKNPAEYTDGICMNINSSALAANKDAGNNTKPKSNITRFISTSIFTQTRVIGKFLQFLQYHIDFTLFI